MERHTTYPDGIAGVLAQMDGRRAPLRFAEGEALPPLDVDLDDMAQTRVPPVQEDALRAMPVASENDRKFRALRAELSGNSELAVLHGLLIAHLRKRGQPAHAAALFHRLWAEQAEHLLGTLDPRWQVSAVTTFGDHGRTPVQREVGGALSVLFGTMKLYETERRFSGFDAQRPFPLDRLRRTTLPMQMDAFCLASGGLDVNMLGRLWRQAEEDAVIRPLAHGLLEQLIHDPATVFRRLRRMRQRRARKAEATKASPPQASEASTAQSSAARASEAPPAVHIPVPAAPPTRLARWGAVCTSHAPLPDIAAWAAHYLELGAHHLDLYLDMPDPATSGFLTGHPQITVTTCDDAYWTACGKARPETHQQRQSHNATRSLRGSALDFLGHFDTDEFVIASRPVARALARCPAEAACARIRPVELLAPVSGPPRHFKRAHRVAGHPKSVLETLYPTFGAYLTSALLSHSTGKVFARTGLDGTRLGLHTLKYQGAEAANRAELPDMALAHLHCRDVTAFLTRMAFRLAHGSYRKPATRDAAMGLSDVLGFLREAEGEDGLRAFFDEVCTARPALLAALRDKDMLLTHDLDLAAKVARHFGPLPAGRGTP